MGERSFLSPLACLLIANLVVSNECDESARSATVDDIEPNLIYPEVGMLYGVSVCNVK